MKRIELTYAMIADRRAHLEKQKRDTLAEIQRLQGQYAAIDGALQDVAFWESKIDEEFKEELEADGTQG